MSEDSKDVKPNAESEHINLKVIGQDGSIIHFKIKKQTPLRKLMTTYCDRTGLNIANVRFRFDGQPINETDSPNQLEMEEGDTIEVFQQQTGGHTVDRYQQRLSDHKECRTISGQTQAHGPKDSIL